MIVRVDNRVRLRLDPSSEDVEKALLARFAHQNPKRIAMQKAKVRGFWSEPVVIATWSRSPDGELSFPRGGLRKVLETLRERGIGYRVQDERADVPCIFPELSEALRPDAHQLRIVDAVTAKQNCLVKAPVGSGKTVAVLMLAAALKRRTLVIMPTTMLAEQWVDQAVDKLGLAPREIGMLGGGKHTVGQAITVGTSKSVASALADPEFASKFGLVVYDEVHGAAAQTVFDVVDKFPAKWRVGVSDDARRKDQKEFLIYDLFGEEACVVADKEVVAAGRTMDVETYVIPTEFRADWYRDAVGEAHAGTDKDAKSPEYGQLLAEMAADADRNAIVEGIVERELAAGNQVLMFASHREHVRELGAMASRHGRAGFLVGGADFKSEFRRTKAGMKAGKIRAAVGTYQACGTGIDIPGVEVGIGVTPCLSNRQRFRQARGRISRKSSGKRTARFYVLYDRHVFGLSHVENAWRWGGGMERTFVWDGTEWIGAREYVRRERNEA